MPDQRQWPGLEATLRTLLLLAIQCERVEARLLVPERLVEPREKRRGFRSQLRRASAVAQGIVDFSHAQPGIVHVALQLAERLWALHQRAVGIDQGVAGILPALVLKSGGRARGVFLKAVPVAVAVLVDPIQAALRGRQMTLEQLAVAGATPGRMQRDQIERRRVRSSVVGRVRHQLELGELAQAEFVHDLARLGIAIIVALGRLQRAEHVERPARKVGTDESGLQRDDQAVAAEQGHEPWQPGGRHELHVIGAGDGQAQCRHVVRRLPEQAPECVVAAVDLEHIALPVGEPLAVFRLVAASRCIRPAPA